MSYAVRQFRISIVVLSGSDDGNPAAAIIMVDVQWSGGRGSLVAQRARLWLAQKGCENPRELLTRDALTGALEWEKKRAPCRSRPREVPVLVEKGEESRS
jgi:hypothetical protein